MSNNNLPIENQPIPENEETTVENETIVNETETAVKPEVEQPKASEPAKTVSNETASQPEKEPERPDSKEIDPLKDNDKKRTRKRRYEKNVSTKQCIISIIGSLIALLVLLIPIDLDNNVLAFQGLPFIGDGSFFITQQKIAFGLESLANLEPELCELIGVIFNYALYAYVGILCLNIFFSLVLIITRSVIARVFFKFLSIIFGIAMLAIALCQLVYVGGYVGLVLAEMGGTGPAIPTDHGLIFAIAIIFVSVVMIRRQFKWFARWY